MGNHQFYRMPPFESQAHMCFEPDLFDNVSAKLVASSDATRGTNCASSLFGLAINVRQRKMVCGPKRQVFVFSVYPNCRQDTIFLPLLGDIIKINAITTL